MLEDRALRFRIRVCTRIFRPRQLLMKTAPGTQAQILASGSGNHLDLRLICRRRRALEIPASTAANELLRQSGKSSHVTAPTNRIGAQGGSLGRPAFLLRVSRMKVFSKLKEEFFKMLPPTIYFFGALRVIGK